MNEAWKMVWCLFEFRSGGVQRKRPPARAFSPCSPALSSGAPKTPISFPLISSSKPAVFRDIFSCLVVSDWLWSSCCLRAALYTNSEQCQKSKIRGMPSPWVRRKVATWSPLCVYAVLLESILKSFQATPWGEHSREPSGQAWSELPVPPPPHLSL